MRVDFKRGLAMVAAALVTCACLALASVAEAETKTLKGGVKGDSDSGVVLKVKVDGHGLFKGIKSLSFTKVDTCIGELSGKIPGKNFTIGRSSPKPGVTGFSFSGAGSLGDNTIASSGFIKAMPKPKRSNGYFVATEDEQPSCEPTKDYSLK